MKRSFFAALILTTFAFAGCQTAQPTPANTDSQQSTSQVSASATGEQSGTQQNISETQQTRLKVEGEKILPTDKPIVVDLSTVYDATAHREGSETQAVKP